eukprot:3677459-Alexandrium_andersonii.AAC.1
MGVYVSKATLVRASKDQPAPVWAVKAVPARWAEKDLLEILAGASWTEVAVLARGRGRSPWI